MRKKAVQQGRSERRGEAYSSLYVESLSDARTPLAGFINSLLAGCVQVDGWVQPLFTARSTQWG